MTNKNFIEALAERTGKSKRETKEFIDAFEKLLKESVGAEKIKVADLTFSVKDVAAHNGVNPKTQEKIVIPASKRLSVKASNNFREFIQ